MIITVAEYITIVAERLHEAEERVELAMICFGRNFKAIQNFLLQNRGCCL